MIRMIFYGQKAAYSGFSVQGHADYAEAGADIVCAAVSALTQTALAALLGQMQDGNAVQWIRQEGSLQVRLPQGLSLEDKSTANILLEALQTGVTMIQEQYPEYVSVVMKKNGR